MICSYIRNSLLWGTSMPSDLALLQISLWQQNFIFLPSRMWTHNLRGDRAAMETGSLWADLSQRVSSGICRQGRLDFVPNYTVLFRIKLGCEKVRPGCSEIVQSHKQRLRVIPSRVGGHVFGRHRGVGASVEFVNEVVFPCPVWEKKEFGVENVCMHCLRHYLPSIS